MCGKGGAATTSNTQQAQTASYAPAGGQQMQNIYNMAQQTASTPYQPYTGELVAPLNGYQFSGVNQIMDSGMQAQPYLNTAGDWTGQGYGNIGQGAGMIGGAMNPLYNGMANIQQGAGLIGNAQNLVNSGDAAATFGAQGVGNIGAGDIGQYMNPFTQNVTQATLGNMAENNAQQQLNVQGNAAMRGALGGDRLGVAQSELARQQGLADNQTLANLNSQNYQQATQTALSQQQNQQANQNRLLQASGAFGGLGATQAGIGSQYAGTGNAMVGAAGQQAGIGNLYAGTGMQYGSLGSQLGNIGLQAQNAGITGGQALLGAGTVSQQNQQAMDTANYQQYLQQLAFPYQQAQFMAGIGLPAAGAMGGTQSQIGATNQVLTPPGMSWAQGLVGGGALLGGLLGSKRGGRIEGFDAGGAVDSPNDDIYDSIERAMEQRLIPGPTQIVTPNSKPTPTSMGTGSMPSQASQAASTSGLGTLGSVIGDIAGLFFDKGGRIPHYDGGGGVYPLIGGGSHPYGGKGFIPKSPEIQTPKVMTGAFMKDQPMMSMAKAASATPGITAEQMRQLGDTASRLATVDGEAASGGRIPKYPTGGAVYPNGFDPSNRFPYPPPIPQFFPSPPGLPEQPVSDFDPTFGAPVNGPNNPNNASSVDSTLSALIGAASMPAGAGGGDGTGTGTGPGGSLADPGSGGFSFGDLGPSNGFGGTVVGGFHTGAPAISVNSPNEPGTMEMGAPVAAPTAAPTTSAPTAPTAPTAPSAPAISAPTAIDQAAINNETDSGIAAALASAIAAQTAPTESSPISPIDVSANVIDIGGNNQSPASMVSQGFNSMNAMAPDQAAAISLDAAANAMVADMNASSPTFSDAIGPTISQEGVSISQSDIDAAAASNASAIDAAGMQAAMDAADAASAAHDAGMSSASQSAADVAAGGLGLGLGLGAALGLGDTSGNGVAISGGATMDGGMTGFDTGIGGFDAAGLGGITGGMGFGGMDVSGGDAGIDAGGGDAASGDGGGSGGMDAGGDGGWRRGGASPYRAAGGMVYPYNALQGYDEGGDVDSFEDRWGGFSDKVLPAPVPPNAQREAGMPLIQRAMRDAQDKAANPVDSFADRWPGDAQAPLPPSAPLPRPRPAEAPSPIDEAAIPPAATPAQLPGASGPYAAAAQAASANNPTQAGWGEIMNTRSPMYQSAVPERLSPRQMLMNPATRGRALSEFGARVLAANPAQGWAGAVGQGALGTLGTFDKFSNEDLSARQKAQSLASQIKKHAETLGEATRHHRSTEDIQRDRVAQDNWKYVGVTQGGAPIMLNTKTSEMINGATQEPLSPEDKMVLGGRGAGSGKMLPMEYREMLANRIFPNDPKLAAAMALGQLKAITPQLRLGVKNSVDREWDNLFPKPKGITADQWKANKERETLQTIEQFAAPSPSGGAAPPAAGGTAADTDGAPLYEGKVKPFKEGLGIYQNGKWGPYKP